MKRNIIIGLATIPAIVLAQSIPRMLPTANAQIIGDDDATAVEVAQCGQLYSFPGHDPAGLWAKISDPASRVVHVTFISVPEILGTGTRTHPLGNRESQIFWDHTHPVIKDGVRSGRCEVLYHELQHAQDIADDLPDAELSDLCDGIPQAEWRAVAAQNAFRAAIDEKQMRKSSNGKEFKSPSYEECKKKAKPPAKPAGNSVFGDPHILTTDHLIYSLQQVGEFTAFTSDAAEAPRVQVRTAPVAESSIASLVSAVAASTADHRVSFVLRGETVTITDLAGTSRKSVTVDNGAVHDLGGGVTLSANEPELSFRGSAYTLHWADGSELDVESAGYWGLRVAFKPSDKAKAAAPRGLLGNFNGDAADDLTRPDGRVVPSDAPAAIIRSDFGDPWRINQADSLFAYDLGESTATFTDRNFPQSQPQFPKSVTDQARQTCLAAGITSDAILEACTFDVAVTGNPALAAVAARVASEVEIDTAALPDSVTTGPGPLRDGSKVTGTITDSKQSKTYDLDFGPGTVFWVADWRGTSERCEQTFSINLLAVSHNNFPCTGQHLGFHIPDDGKPHQLEIESTDSGTGPFSFGIITEKIRSLSTAPGATVSGDIDVRGREDRYELPLGLPQVRMTSTLNCSGDNINKQIGLYDLTENRVVRSSWALCTGELGPWKLEDPTHRYALTVENTELGTGPYSFMVK